ncbi:MAG: uroporphyrinogen-III synthase [Deltaproteobacteria bacterium]|nr:uroporphyrinogen-III synthase [Deltaproteobacteria bacterium]
MSDSGPLRGKRVLITRAAHQAASTLERLRARGADPLAFPTIAMVDPPEPARVTRAAQELSTYDLVVFTSENSVHRFFEELERLDLDATAFDAAKVAAIGPATGASLTRKEIKVDIASATYVAEHLAEAIIAASLPADARVLLPRALVAPETLPDALRAAGFQVDVVPVYQTVTASLDRRDELARLLPSVDIVMLTSSSTVTNLCALLGDDAVALLAPCMIASIGPVTTATAVELGMDVAVTSTESTTPGLIETIEAALG